MFVIVPGSALPDLGAGQHGARHCKGLLFLSVARGPEHRGSVLSLLQQSSVGRPGLQNFPEDAGALTSTQVTHRDGTFLFRLTAHSTTTTQGTQGPSASRFVWPATTTGHQISMGLYATGFNAWRQLQFEDPTDDQEPDDIASFTCVLRDVVVNTIRPFFSYTRGESLVTLRNPMSGLGS
jgi:hypothetical protein